MSLATKEFTYEVVDNEGKKRKGKLEGTSTAGVASRLKTMGFAPLDIKEAPKTGLQRDLKLPGMQKVALKDLAIMSRQFATMINSGLSLLRALAILSDQTSNPLLRTTLQQVTAQVESGTSLSSAMTQHPKVFPPLMVNMCRAGEVGGFLDSVLLQLAESFEKEVRLRAKVKSAMTYPTVVFVIAILAVIGMLLFIVPVFTKMFTELGGDLPLPTKILVFLSDAMVWLAPIGLVVGVVGAVAWFKVRHQENVRRVVDPLILKMPVFGSLFQKVALSRFCRNLGTMLRSGVPILQSLEIVGEAAGNMVVRNATQEVQASVRRGESMAGPLQMHPVFPAMMVQMLAVGEDTGALDAMLDKLSDFYDQEVETTTEQLTSLIEPIMIAVLGGIVGAMIVALYMPIFKVFDLIQ